MSERGRQVVGWARLLASLHNRQPLRVGRDFEGAVVTSVERAWQGAQSRHVAPGSFRRLLSMGWTLLNERIERRRA